MSDCNRGHQHSVATDKGPFFDHGPVFVFAVVVTSNHTGTDVDLRPDRSVAHVAEVAHYGPSRKPARFDFHELDIEDVEVIQSVLSEIGVDATNFASFVASEGRLMHNQIRTEAEKKGIFGVPTYVLGNEIFWGREHLPLVRLRLNEMKLTRPGVDVTVDTTHAWRPLGPGW